MLLLVFLLPALARARISIGVDVASREEDVNIRLSGKLEHPISEKEREMFGLSESNVKEYMEQKVYLPYVTLKHYVLEVKTSIKPIKATIIDMDSETVVLGRDYFENTNPTTAEYRADLSKKVTTTMSHAFDDTKNINARTEIRGEVGISCAKIVASASLEYNHQWGTSDSKSTTTTIRSKSGFTVPVKPGHWVEANMVGSYGSMKVEVDYDYGVSGTLQYVIEAAMATGCQMTDHYIVDINDVLQWRGGKRMFQLSETITVDFYTDVHIKLNGNAIDNPDNYSEHL